MEHRVAKVASHQELAHKGLAAPHALREQAEQPNLQLRGARPIWWQRGVEVIELLTAVVQRIVDPGRAVLPAGMSTHNSR